MQLRKDVPHAGRRGDEEIKSTLGIARSRVRWLRRGLLGLALAGCTGQVGGAMLAGNGSTGASASGSGNGSGTGGGTGASAGTSVAGVGSDGGPAGPCVGLTSRRVRRLAMREYANVVGGLLGAAAEQQVVAAWPAEPPVNGFDNQDIALFISPSLQETISDLALQLSTAVTATTVAPCATTGGSATCLQSFIKSFTEQAYGRPITAAENASYVALAGTAPDYATSVQMIVEMVLQSPYTLYVSELGPDDGIVASADGGSVTGPDGGALVGQGGGAPSLPAVLLTPYEIASQISFMVTGTRPDATLLQAAQTAGFNNASDIQTQVQRLLVTAPGQASLARFITGWMDMGPMSTVPKSPDVYPEYTQTLAAAMQQEFDTFVSTQLNGGNGTLSDFLTATSTNIPAALDSVYGSDLLKSGQLDPTRRKGLLSLPAVLTYNSNDINSGPIERGLLVRRQLLCQVVLPPPAVALAAIAANPFTLDAGITTREFFETHASQPACSGCHAQFDPIGFGLEDMDGMGRFRSTDNGLPVDSSGQLTATDVDGTFTGPAQLSVLLSQSQEVASCMVNHFFNFDQARDPVAADSCTIQNWATQFSQGGGKIIDLVNASVADRTFVYREDDR
jgi:hypothetical protein